MRICFTSDLHGRPVLYEQLTEFVRSEQPDVLVLGGDMHADCERDDPFGTQVAFIERELAPRCDLWREMAPGLDVVCILGNHDVACTAEALRRQAAAGRLVLLDHRTPWCREGLAFLGLGFSPPSPYWAKDFERLDLPGDVIPDFDGAVWDARRGKLVAVRAQEHFRRQATIQDVLSGCGVPAGAWVFVCHAPPADSKLDRLPYVERPIGSRAVRAFIERHQPLCALHGHVHESPQVTGTYRDGLGRTVCVNPGQEHERLHAVVFDTERPAETLRHTVYG